MLLDGHEESWGYKVFGITLGNIYICAGRRVIHDSLAAGCVSLFLDELDEFEARVEESVDAVGEARLFGAREAVRGCSGHALVPTHASHLVYRFLNPGLSLLLFDELAKFLLCRVVESVHLEIVEKGRQFDV